MIFIKRYKPTTNGSRHRLSLSSSNINSRKIKVLTTGFKKNSGRNINGSIVVRHRVNKTSKNYVNIDFNRKNFLNLAVCLNITHDANRSTLIALIKYSNGSYSYILAPHGIVNGSLLQTISRPEIFSSNYKIGYHVFLKNINPRAIFFNLSLNPYLNGKYARSAGTYCMLLAHNFENNMTKIRLPSNKIL
jgi:large subunit ribosomal protein L2